MDIPVSIYEQHQVVLGLAVRLKHDMHKQVMVKCEACGEQHLIDGELEVTKGTYGIVDQIAEKSNTGRWVGITWFPVRDTVYDEDGDMCNEIEPIKSLHQFESIEHMETSLEIFK